MHVYIYMYDVYLLQISIQGLMWSWTYGLLECLRGTELTVYKSFLDIYPNTLWLRPRLCWLTTELTLLLFEILKSLEVLQGEAQRICPEPAQAVSYTIWLPFIGISPNMGRKKKNRVKTLLNKAWFPLFFKFLRIPEKRFFPEPSSYRFTRGGRFSLNRCRWSVPVLNVPTCLELLHKRDLFGVLLP